MEITAEGITAFKQAATASEIAIRVAKKILDANKAEGQAAISLLESAVKVQQQERSYATSPGGSLDVMA
jgi:hypothetical protein